MRRSAGSGTRTTLDRHNRQAARGGLFLKTCEVANANEQIVWMLKGKMEFRLGSEQRVCGPGDVVVIPGGSERWFREDTEVIDFFAPPLLGGKPAYMSEG